MQAEVSVSHQKREEEIGLKHFKDPKTLIEYSNDIKDVCSNIEVYNIGKEQKVSKVFDDMIADMISNKELHPTVTELLIKDNTTLPLDNTLRF